jgi:hypothetical protein
MAPVGVAQIGSSLSDGLHSQSFQDGSPGQQYGSIVSGSNRWSFHIGPQLSISCQIRSLCHPPTYIIPENGLTRNLKLEVTTETVRAQRQASRTPRSLHPTMPGRRAHRTRTGERSPQLVGGAARQTPTRCNLRLPGTPSCYPRQFPKSSSTKPLPSWAL